MKKDVECPYCGHEQDIDHDEGYGYEEDEMHSQSCDHCEKCFGFYTYISYTYGVVTCSCLNGAPHDFEKRDCFESFVKWTCRNCDCVEYETKESK